MITSKIKIFESAQKSMISDIVNVYGDSVVKRNEEGKKIGD